MFSSFLNIFSIIVYIIIMNFKEIFNKLIKYNNNNYYFSLMSQPDNSSVSTPEDNYKVFPNIKEK